MLKHTHKDSFLFWVAIVQNCYQFCGVRFSWAFQIICKEIIDTDTKSIYERYPQGNTQSFVAAFDIADMAFSYIDHDRKFIL